MKNLKNQIVVLVGVVLTTLFLVGCDNAEKKARLELNNSISFYQQNPERNGSIAMEQLNAIAKKYPQTTAATEARAEAEKIGKEGVQRAINAGNAAMQNGF
jgi:hypothetical protein